MAAGVDSSLITASGTVEPGYDETLEMEEKNWIALFHLLSAENRIRDTTPESEGVKWRSERLKFTGQALWIT
jgi:hypothetical protein